MKKIGISTEYITLGQLLKLGDCIATGGEAKMFLQEKKVLVNGEPDNRRGRKLVPGDTVEVEGCGTFTVTVRKA
ncbi:S4 domain-containing protein YaaA [Cohnella sp. CFH 77786]|uniref:S4 domain-containing protein YaaA n=1 Tax=Cohnella sp. CFH 77786 TaxID=2662265 RepID=UPI001C610270|nr:S4 domain-containing protein YaaA [Cohnella sp. CFH 77786]MBW5448808.1 S4 domain-containing protein YaaA [Cohnella sp. CFH 77786]